MDKGVVTGGGDQWSVLMTLMKNTRYHREGEGGGRYIFSFNCMFYQLLCL